MPVVVGVGDAPVDLRGWKDEAAPLAERDDLVHGHRAGHWGEQAIDREQPGVSATSCEDNVTICSVLGYGRVDGRISPAPDLAHHRLDRLARRAGIPSGRPQEPQAARERLNATLSGTHILRVHAAAGSPCK